MTTVMPAGAARASAQARIAGRRHRIRRIRRRVVATALVVFTTAWSVIFFQLMSGHDPGLAAGSAKHARAVARSSSRAAQSGSSSNASPSSSSPSSGSSSGSSSSGSSSSGSSGSSSGSSSSSPAPVTTQQS